MVDNRLTQLTTGQIIPCGGDRFTAVSPQLAESFVDGDRLVVVQDDGALLHIAHQEHDLVTAAVERAHIAFRQLPACSDQQISDFYERFATLLGDDEVFAVVAAANAADVDAARARGRSITRLVLSETMRADMINGLRMWRDISVPRDSVDEQVEHAAWSVAVRRAPLGLIGFVFEGRPNVFADATGVLRSGNCAVLRIGSDALGTARAMMAHVLTPALASAGLPAGAICLIDSPQRSTGWALFSDKRLSLAVARGSGTAVAQLGAVARQSGIPVSLHGTGGAWLVASVNADAGQLTASLVNSLDRKVCNTVNVCCLDRRRAAEFVPLVLAAAREAGRRRGTVARLHAADDLSPWLDAATVAERVCVSRPEGDSDEPLIDRLAIEELGMEWEWENSPELSVVLVDSVDHAVELFNRYSPRLAASLISDNAAEQERFYDAVDAPFVGNGMTRWVDGQFALGRPELGLSNWADGRLLARSAVLSGDSVFTRRLQATMRDYGLHR